MQQAMQKVMQPFLINLPHNTQPGGQLQARCPLVGPSDLSIPPFLFSAGSLVTRSGE